MTNRLQLRSQNGYIALITMLVVGAASLAIALTLLVNGTDSQRAGLVAQQSAGARGLADACMEEALQQMHDNSAFTGTNSITLGKGTCSYTITNNGGNNRTVDVTGTVSNVVRKIQAHVTINTSDISVTSWQEVS
jgi:hypothetical protein